MSQKPKNPYDLPEERPASFDEVGDRVKIYPAAVTGHWRTRRTQVHFILVFVFLILPWIKINGHPAILLNLPERKFAFFGLTFWAHDLPLLFFVIASTALGLIFVTALWGRVWCGWACPQTVFIDAIYRWIEFKIEGNHLERRRLDQSPTTFASIFKKSLKWFVFLIVTMVVTHSFLAYFVGPDRILKMIQTSPRENWESFLVIAFMTGILLFNFGWFREQFCIIMCPYGRLQSALVDERSLGVIYDSKRGEPRKGIPSENPQGDCISCFKCVAVCPTGVDIRRGFQMECIQCTACIDACDEVMEKIGKPKGLIRYGSASELFENLKINSSRLRIRPLLYGLILLTLIGGFIGKIILRVDLHGVVLRAIDDPFKILPNRSGDSSQEGRRIINHFKIHLQNQTFDSITGHFKLPQEMILRDYNLITPQSTFTLAGGHSAVYHFFIEFPFATKAQRVLDSENSLQVEYHFEAKNSSPQKKNYPLQLLTPD